MRMGLDIDLSVLSETEQLAMAKLYPITGLDGRMKHLFEIEIPFHHKDHPHLFEDEHAHLDEHALARKKGKDALAAKREAHKKKQADQVAMMNLNGAGKGKVAKKNKSPTGSPSGSPKNAPDGSIEKSLAAAVSDGNGNGNGADSRATSKSKDSKSSAADSKKKASRDKSKDKHLKGQYWDDDKKEWVKKRGCWGNLKAWLNRKDEAVPRSEEAYKKQLMYIFGLHVVAGVMFALVAIVPVKKTEMKAGNGSGSKLYVHDLRDKHKKWDTGYVNMYPENIEQDHVHTFFGYSMFVCTFVMQIFNVYFWWFHQKMYMGVWVANILTFMFCSGWFWVWHLTLVLDWENLDGEGYDYCAQYGCDDHDKPLWLEYPIAYWGVYIEMFIFVSQFIFAMRYCYAMFDPSDHLYNKYIDINYKVDYTAMNLKRISALGRADEKGGKLTTQLIHSAHEDRRAERKDKHEQEHGAKDKKAKEAHERMKKLAASRDKGAATKNPDGYKAKPVAKKPSKDGKDTGSPVSPSAVKMEPVPFAEGQGNDSVKPSAANGDTGADDDKDSKLESLQESHGASVGESVAELQA